MRVLLALLTLVCVTGAQTALPPPAKTKVDFIRDIEPLLARKCHSCHGDQAQQSGLRLDRRQNAMRGGDYGVVIVAGKSAESKLIKRVAGGDGGMQMPPTGALATEEIALLRAWIDQGVDWRIEVREEAPPKPLDPKIQALITSVRADDKAAVSRTLAAGADLIKAHDNAGSTLLHHAAGFASAAMVELLLSKGADPNAGNRLKSTPLHWGIHDEAKVRLLIAGGAAVDTKQSEGRTPLYQAALLGNGNHIMRLLLDKGADPNAATAAGGTPLMATATRGNVEGMQMLLAAKAEVNARSGTGATALMGAASSGNADAVRLLLARGADPGIATKKHETALMDAATSGNEESVKLLLERDAAVNARDDRGYSALMYAAAADAMTLGSVKRLLDKGADASYTAEGETACSLASKRGDTAIARLLGAPGAEHQSLGVVAVKQSKPRPVSEAVEKAMGLLEKQSHNFIRIGGCNSCHAQDLPSAAAAVARDRGLAAPRSIAQLSESMRGTGPERLMDFSGPSVGTAGWELFDFGMNHAAPTTYTDSLVRYIKSMQSAEGNWRSPIGRRPPINTGEYQTTALAIYSMVHYSPEAEKDDSRKAVARAAAWLDSSRPASTQDRAFQLMGLVWAKAGAKSIARSAKELAATQRADGGWSQLPAMGSDAYATGQALYALYLSGETSPGDDCYRKGAAYLLGSQATDGSWHVKTRSIWIQPYFESGFPYDHDQWISAAGTAWASMALSVSQERPKLGRR